MAGLERVGDLPAEHQRAGLVGLGGELAGTLHWAVSGTYSSRVERLSRIVTLPIGWLPTLSKRMVKSTVSPGSAKCVEATLITRSWGWAGGSPDGEDGPRLLVADRLVAARLVEDHLHRLGMRPDDGGR